MGLLDGKVALITGAGGGLGIPYRDDEAPQVRALLLVRGTLPIVEPCVVPGADDGARQLAAVGQQNSEVIKPGRTANSSCSEHFGQP